MKNIKKSSGEISRGLLIFGGIIIVAVIISFIVIKVVTRPPAPPPVEDGEDEVYQPVYEVVIKDVKFTLKTAKNKGNVLRGSESKSPKWQKDLTTTEKFIEVTIGAENIGKEKTPNYNWDIGEIIDSEGRKFEPLGSKVSNWIPKESQCGASLKPAFSSIPCTKIYEVAAVSTDLKVRVFVKEPKEESFVDLFVTPENTEFLFP